MAGHLVHAMAARWGVSLVETTDVLTAADSDARTAASWVWRTADVKAGCWGGEKVADWVAKKAVHWACWWGLMKQSIADK